MMKWMINKFLHDQGQLREAYPGGGRDGDEGKMVEDGMSGGGSEQPLIANSTMLSSLGVNSCVMTDCTHKIRMIQHINKRVAKVRTKIMEESATNILLLLSGGE
jgi:hypothetical protein